jgi:SM-20-related protein
VSLRINYGSVQVFDDALPDQLFKELMVNVGRIGWQFGWTTQENKAVRYWHHEVGHGAKDNVEDVSETVRKHRLPVFARYQDWLRSTLVPPDTKIVRYYLNAHTYGTEGWPHTDTDRDDELTVVLYLVGGWQPAWCGETVVFGPEGDIEAAVLPRRNRLMAFPSNRLHAPRPLSRSFIGLRAVLVVKLAPAEGGADFFNRLLAPAADGDPPAT